MSGLNVTDIAKVCHEVNKSYCESIGDLSQKSWEDSPVWQNVSAINGVTYHLKNANAKPSDSHISWLKEKLENGWSYGPKKDEIKKEHPCCVPYNDLPKEQKAKDFIFSAIVKQLKKWVFI